MQWIPGEQLNDDWHTLTLPSCCSELAFRIATQLAFKQGFTEAQPQVCSLA